jgi:DNA polymerase-3 subunit delta
VLEVRSFPSNTRLAKAVHKHGLIITTSTPPRFDLTAWLQQWAAQTYSIELPTVTASTILERLGDELGQIDQALSTFAAALPQDGKRSLPPEMVDSLEGMGHQRTVWEMVDAAAAGRTTEAISLLNGLLDAGESPIGLTAQAATVLRRYSTAARLLGGPDRPTSLGAALKEAGVASWPKALSQAELALRSLGSHRCRELPKWLESLDRSLKAESSRGLRARLAIERFFCMMSTSAKKPHEK